jgi:hypothetical protein
MNNFQLNNTSVYLGGQCKWDIILSHRDDTLIVSGFQLTPISSNVSFNKKGDVTSLNENHSYTLKKFHNELKESFWSTNPCLSEHTRNENKQITGYYDDSFTAGLRRAPSYQVYNKQYELLQPLWLEQMEEGQYLKFKFNIYSTNNSGKRTLIDSCILDLKPLDETKYEGVEFHNEFVEYFYNWLRYLNIMGDGNDQVMFIDLPNNKAQIDGVSILSGQRSGKITCDYVTDNLLNFERPNIETDYILSTLFKNHNAVCSQLFNFNFCFDASDILDPFLLKQMRGSNIAMDTDLHIMKPGNSRDTIISEVERRTLFSNYEYVKKDIYCPFLFIAACEDINPNQTTGQSAGNFRKNYVLEYQPHWIDPSNNSTPISDEECNVLNYLKDNEVEDIKDKNKIVQPIVHWGFVTHDTETFNLYGGYSPYLVAGVNEKRVPLETGDPYVYNVDTYMDARSTNGVMMPIVSTNYDKYNGSLSWLYPKNIIYLDRNEVSDWSQELLTKFTKTYWMNEKGLLQQSCKWNIKDSLMKFYVDENDVGVNDTLTIVYINNFPYYIPTGTAISSQEWADAQRNMIKLDSAITYPGADTWTYIGWGQFTEGPLQPDTLNPSTFVKLYYRVHNSGEGYEATTEASTNDSGDNTKFDFLLVVNDLKLLSLQMICSDGYIIPDVHPTSTPILTDTGIVSINLEFRFRKLTETIKKYASTCNNEYDFYGFGQELEVGADELQKLRYYIPLNNKTFLYRKCGKLSPSINEDPDMTLNYNYHKSAGKYATIVKNDYDRDLKYTFENRELGKGKILVMMGKIEFTVEKETSDTSTTIRSLIINQLKRVYGITDADTLDYIYNLYDIKLNYDYKYIDSLDTIQYNIKMILR